MKIHWANKFYNLAESKGIKCRIEQKVREWIETIDFLGKKYFTKSVSYEKGQYFIGVDPSKLKEDGDFVLICGGKINTLSDIFIIPWEIFFKTLAKGERINTYKPPKKEYYQYKFYLRYREKCWLMSVQGGERPIFDVSKWHYSVEDALSRLHS